ncbi:MAG: T9SS type A sorting domain-containing protein [Candidatus Kapabacteria bacterium]|nr:T9SS type A sorting domain-containing protein [Candidatus Kapabacteria bacterium]
MKNLLTIILIFISINANTYAQSIEWVKCSDKFNNENLVYSKEFFLTPSNIIFTRDIKNVRVIWYSSDEGQTWNDLFKDNKERFFPSNFVVTEDNTIFATTGESLHRSTDNGLTWSLFLISHGGTINQYVITPDRKIAILTKSNSLIVIYDMDSRQILKSINLFDTRYLMVSGNDIYIITNYNTHVLKNYSDKLITLSNFRQKGYNLVIIDTVFIFNPQTTSDLRISYDYGSTWEELKIYDIDLKDRINGNMLKDSQKNLYVFVDYEGLFKSSDLGKTWKKCLNLNKKCFRIYVSPKDELLLMPYNSELLRSNDRGESWYEIKLPKPEPNDYDIVDLASNISDNIYIFREDNSSYISTNKGEEWIYQGSYNIPYQIAINDSGDIYHLYRGGGLGIKYSGTNGLMPSNNGLNHNLNTIFISNKEDLLLLGTIYGGIYRSTSNGLLWRRVTSDTAIFSVEHIQRDTNGDYYAISMDVGLLKSTNKGYKWTFAANSEFYSDTIIDFKINSKGDFFVLKNTGELFFSLEKGANWEKLELPLNNLKANSFVFSKSNDIFVGTDYYGVLRYNFQSKKWINETSGLQSMMTRFIRSDSSGYLYCSVPKKGLYRSKEPVQDITSVNDDKTLKSEIAINPNPAGEFIEINYNVETALRPVSTGGINIYNILGECVLSEKIHPITLSYRMNIEHLPSGIYYVRLGDWVGSFVKIE